MNDDIKELIKNSFVDCKGLCPINVDVKLLTVQSRKTGEIKISFNPKRTLKSKSKDANTANSQTPAYAKRFVVTFGSSDVIADWTVMGFILPPTKKKQPKKGLSKKR